jgi:ubiquitin carboxyl-terminal hydrolase 4/11/15
MSSSLQCLANVPAFRDFFLSGEYRESLCIQNQYTERTAGKLAEGFAQFLRRLWNAEMRAAVSPYAFKDLVDNIDDRFSDNRQHDSMEFIEFLVDGLKEDCNRVKGKKPYVERKDADGRPDEQVALEESTITCQWC